MSNEVVHSIPFPGLEGGGVPIVRIGSHESLVEHRRIGCDEFTLLHPKEDLDGVPFPVACALGGFGTNPPPELSVFTTYYLCTHAMSVSPTNWSVKEDLLTKKK